MTCVPTCRVEQESDLKDDSWQRRRHKMEAQRLNLSRFQLSDPVPQCLWPEVRSALCGKFLLQV